MKKTLLLLILTGLLMCSCNSKKSVSTASGTNDNSYYNQAKTFLAAAQYNRGIDAIDRAIEANEKEHLEELFFLKGFILHAYGETTDARSAYQEVLDMKNVYSPYKKLAKQLLELNIEEEKWRKKRMETKEEDKTFTEEQIQEVSPEDLPFKPVEKLPRFTSCPESNNIEVKNCFNEVIKNHLVRNYNTDIGNMFGVYNKVRTYVTFKVDVDGKIIDMSGRSKSRFLSLEAKRVLFTLPEMVPGEQDGKNVVVSFTIPVTFAPIQ